MDTTSANATNTDLTEIQYFVDDIKRDVYIKETYVSASEYIDCERREAAEEADRRAEEA